MTTWVHPVRGGYFTSGYGMRWGRLHEGVDIGKGHRAPIRAAASGTVTASYYHPTGGQMIAISHGKGLATWYLHLDERRVGRHVKVNAGQVIGYMGTTGTSTATHLHFQVMVNGKSVDPLPFMRDRGVELYIMKTAAVNNSLDVWDKVLSVPKGSRPEPLEKKEDEMELHDVIELGTHSSTALGRDKLSVGAALQYAAIGGFHGPAQEARRRQEHAELMRALGKPVDEQELARELTKAVIPLIEEAVQGIVTTEVADVILDRVKERL